MAEILYNREPVVIQFNKLNGVFTGAHARVPDKSILNHDLFLYHDGVMDVDKETVVGDYYNFKIVPLDSLPRRVTEDELNTLARAKILEAYPMEMQLSIIGQLLEKLADANAIECDDLKDMNDYISEVRRVNRLRKEFFAANPDYQYITTEELDDMINKQMEGGIQQYATVARSNSII